MAQRRGGSLQLSRWGEPAAGGPHGSFRPVSRSAKYKKRGGSSAFFRGEEKMVFGGCLGKRGMFREATGGGERPGKKEKPCNDQRGWRPASGKARAAFVMRNHSGGGDTFTEETSRMCIGVV